MLEAHMCIICPYILRQPFHTNTKLIPPMNIQSIMNFSILMNIQLFENTEL